VSRLIVRVPGQVTIERIASRSALRRYRTVTSA
jgi:hypothetical protein